MCAFPVWASAIQDTILFQRVQVLRSEFGAISCHYGSVLAGELVKPVSPTGLRYAAGQLGFTRLNLFLLLVKFITPHTCCLSSFFRRIVVQGN